MRGGWLVISLLIVLGVPAALFAVPARAQRPPDEPANSVRVRGEGVVLAAPDVATLNLGATVRRETPSVAFSEAQAQAAALVERLQAQGVAANDIQTTNISLFPEFAPITTGPAPPTRSQEITGWRATYTFSAKVRDFTRIAAILEEAVTLLGADAQIQGIFFGIENTDALVSQARAEAFSNARAAAVELARLAGAPLGEVVTIEEIVATPPTP
ncbi:MAG: SIMPL domain-containing protein, partial [Dehalococcoidia bacterium]